MKNSICHITSVHLWNDTRIFYKECCSLVEEGYSVSLVAPNSTDDVVSDVRIINVSNSSQSRIYRATIIAFKVFRKALKTKAKIIHFHDPELIWVGCLLRLFGRKVIFDVHENVIAQIEDKQWMKFKGIVKFGYNISEYIASKLFYIIIAEESYKAIFEKRTNEITPVLNFPDIEKFKGLKSVKGGNGILYVGVVTESRAILEIFDALKIIQDKKIDFMFHCVGGVSITVKKAIENSKSYQEIKNKVVFYGQLPVYEAYELANKCSLGISILHPLPNYIRSYSTKIFEYMAIGLPFVVSDFEIYNFVKQRQLGLCVNPSDVEQIADSFETILLNKIDLDAMVDRAKEIVENEYSWASQRKNLIELYSRITIQK